MDAPLDPRRTRLLTPAPPGPGAVVYWMHRDHRLRDNWGLHQALALARGRMVPMAVVYALAPTFLEAAWRQYDFLLRGLEQVADGCERLGIPFFLLHGSPPEAVADFCASCKAGEVVTDFDPLRIKRGWVAELAQRLGNVRLAEVDSRNIVPCWIASDKQEWAARTLRPKIARLLPGFMAVPPALDRPPCPWPGDVPRVDAAGLRSALAVDRSVPPVDWLAAGENAAEAALKRFVAHKLTGYARRRNDPSLDAASRLSPYLHFGMLSGLRAALAVQGAVHAPAEDREAFLEQLIVRRELAENFCAHNPWYDDVRGFPHWATTTLDAHREDPRPIRYSAAQMEEGRTSDPLWNAAQQQLTAQGYMHGYMRMYWAKKILEWSASPEDAMVTAVRLNDRYLLDGRDPNGYTGIAWSIGGVHDRPWFQRPIYGAIRYMSATGAASKFDINAYMTAHWRQPTLIPNQPPQPAGKSSKKRR